MQTVKHRHTNELQVMDDIESVYTLTSEKYPITPLFKVNVDSVFEELFSLYRKYGGVDYQVEFSVKARKQRDTGDFDSRNVILCLSGGKDSTASILRLKTQGYNVYLYHLRGANRFYYDEYEAVEKIAEKLDCPLYFDEMHYSGYHAWTEHPMKNMIIANGALNYGIRENIGTKIAFGNFRDSSLEVDPFDVCAGDCKEMWTAYEHIIRTELNDFEILLPEQNLADTMELMEQNQELIPLVQSCMTPNRFREALRKKNLAKYGEPILEHRCGSCWKCAVEYIWFTDKKIFEYNEAYYKHCLDVLRDTIKKETNSTDVTIDDIWNNYFFYDIEKSKFFEKTNLLNDNHIV